MNVFLAVIILIGICILPSAIYLAVTAKAGVEPLLRK